MDDSRDLVRIGNIEIPLVRSKLRAWLRLEDYRKDLLDAVANKNGEKLIHSLYSYISTASGVSIVELMEHPWWEITRIYRLLYNINTPSIDFPFIRPRKDKVVSDENLEWDYPHRSFYLWANVIASSYGWTLDYISELDIDDALAMIQEILVDEQLQKEFQWGMSQNAYTFDINTKKSKFNPLKRPEWMVVSKKIREIPTVKIRSSEMPLGVILRWEDGTSSKPQ